MDAKSRSFSEDGKYSTSVSRTRDTDSYLSKSSIGSRIGRRKNLNCKQWIEQFPEYYYASCKAHLDEATYNLASRRVHDIQRNRSSNYAKYLSNNPPAVIEEFFSGLALLVERKQEKDSERSSILSFLAELCAIEHNDFGVMGLKSLIELTDSLTNIDSIVADVTRKVLLDTDFGWRKIIGERSGGVLVNMRKEYLAQLSGDLNKLIRQTKAGRGILEQIAKAVDERGGSLFVDTLIECYLYCEANRERDSGSAVDRENFHNDYCSICSLIATCAEDPRPEAEQTGAVASALLRGLGDRIFDLIDVVKKQQQREFADSDEFRLQSAAELDMCAAIIKNQRNAKGVFAAANRVANTSASGKRGGMDRLFDELRDKTNDELKSTLSLQLYQAALVRCINATLLRSTSCKKNLKGVGLVMSVGRFVMQYFKLAQASGQHGAVVLACVDSFWTFLTTPRLWELRESVESQLANRLQLIIKNLMQKKQASLTIEDSLALERCIRIMLFYNELFLQGENHKWFQLRGSGSGEVKNRSTMIQRLVQKGCQVATKLNTSEVKGYDREQILFRVLEGASNSSIFKTNVVVAAAECLGCVPLQQFEQQEIRRVVTTMASMATAGINKSHRIMMQILYLLTRLAMSKGGDKIIARVSDAFRSLYASEVVSMVLELLLKCSTDITGNNDVKYLDEDQRSFMRASVKFLMVAWNNPEMTEGMYSEAAKRAFSRVLQVEQKLVLHALPEQMAQHAPVYIEQTPVGADIGNLLHAVQQLARGPSSRDVVAFRLFNQIANVLQMANLHSDEVPLMDGSGKTMRFTDVLGDACVGKDGSFEHWDKCADGIEIEHMKRIEADELVDEDNDTQHKMKTPKEDEMSSDGDGLGDTKDGLAKGNVYVDIQNLMLAVMMDFKSDETRRALNEKKAKIQAKIKSWSTFDSKRYVYLVRRSQQTAGQKKRGITAMICGGPPRESTRKILGDSIPESAGEMYYVFIHPDCVNDVFINEVFSEFSHQMYLRKYTKCIALVYEEEVSVFSPLAEKGELMLQQFKPQSLRATIKSLSAQKQLPEGPFDIEEFREKNYLRMWDLGVNIWQENTSQKVFLESKGIDIMVQFATQSGGESNFQSPTKALLESRKFGTELMMLLQDGAHELSKQRKPRSDSTLNRLLTETFINPLSVKGLNEGSEYADALKMILTDRNDIGTPIWNKFLVYTSEENQLSISTMTPFPEPYAVKHQSIFRPNPHATEDYLFHRGPPKENDELKAYSTLETSSVKRSIVESSINIDAYKERLYEQCHERDEKMKAERKERAQQKQFLQRKESHVHGVVAAMLRAFYVLITKSSERVREATCKKLRQPSVLYPIIETMKSFDYGVDRSVRDRNELNYGAARKLLQICGELTDINARGHAACLEAIELYDMMSDMALGILDRLKRLISSRDFDTRGIKESNERRLQASDEQLMCEAAGIVSEIVREVASLSFFEGKKAAIVRGNAKCRGASIINMFSKDDKLFNVLLAFLQYDAEVSVTGAEQSDAGGADGNAYLDGDSLYMREYLDQMRINTVNVFAELLYFDENFKYRFYRSFCTGSVRALVGLRQSYIADVLKTAGWSRLRVELNNIMTEKGLLEQGEDEAEVIEELAVVRVQGQYRLFILTSQRYFVSLGVYPKKLHSMTDSKMDGLTQMDWNIITSVTEYKYESIRGIYRALGDQVFAVVSVGAQRGGQNDERVDHYDVMQLGAVNRIIDTFGRYCRDDLDEPLIDSARPDFELSSAELRERKERGDKQGDDDEEEETFWDNALKSLYGEIKLRKEECDLRCHTRAFFGDAGSTLRERTLMCITAGDRQIFVACDTRPSAWSPRSANAGRPKEFYQTPDVVVDFKDVQTIEYTDTEDPRMFITSGDRKYEVGFACDTAREIWRREIRKYVNSGSAKWSSASARPKVIDNISNVVHKFI